MHSEMPNLRLVAANGIRMFDRGVAGANGAELAGEHRTISANAWWFARDQHCFPSIDPMGLRFDEIVVNEPRVDDLFLAAFRHEYVIAPVWYRLRNLAKYRFGWNGGG